MKFLRTPLEAWLDIDIPELRRRPRRSKRQDRLLARLLAEIAREPRPGVADERAWKRFDAEVDAEVAAIQERKKQDERIFVLEGLVAQIDGVLSRLSASREPEFYVGPHLQEWLDEVRAVVSAKHNDPSWSDAVELSVHESHVAWADEMIALANESP